MPSIQFFACFFFAIFFAVMSFRVSKDPKAPGAIKFIFAGLPVLLGILSVLYLMHDMGLSA